MSRARELAKFIGDGTRSTHPAFLVQPSSVQSNMATGTNHTVAFGTERYDQNGDYASNAFTAPVTGRYQFNLNLYVQQLDIDHSYYQPQLNTSNRNYYFIIGTAGFDADMNFHMLSYTILTDMDANDTCNVTFPILSGGSAQVDIGTESTFSGYLVC